MNEQADSKRRGRFGSMKRYAVLAILVAAALLAVGCSKTGVGAGATGGATAEGQATLAPAMRLALGTLRLEGTPQAVSAEQARELATLWRAYRALSQSDTAVAQEVEALVNQIEAAMTAPQREAITAMSLTYADLAKVAEERGIELGAGGGVMRGNLTPEQIATAQALRAQGGAFSGARDGGGPGVMIFEGGLGIPGSGMGPGAAAGSPSSAASAEQLATLQARANLRVPTALLDALIALLAERAQ